MGQKRQNKVREQAPLTDFPWSWSFGVTSLFVLACVALFVAGDQAFAAIVQWALPVPAGKRFIDIYGATTATLLLGLVTIPQFVPMIGLFWLMRARRPQQPNEPRTRANWRPSWPRIASIIAWGLVGAATTLIVDPPVKDPASIMSVSVRMGRPWLMGSFVILFTPIFEEVAFRGIVMNTLRASLLHSRRPWARSLAALIAMFVSSALFGAAHSGHVLMAFVAGATFALVYRRTNNLATPIIAHALNNLVNAINDVM